MNVSNVDRRTPLHVAAAEGHKSTCLCLLAAGANPLLQVNGRPYIYVYIYVYTYRYAFNIYDAHSISLILDRCMRGEWGPRSLCIFSNLNTYIGLYVYSKSIIYDRFICRDKELKRFMYIYKFTYIPDFTCIFQIYDT